MLGGTDASAYKKTGILDALFRRTGKLQISLVSLLELRTESHISGAPNENIVQGHLNIALLNVF